VFFMGVGVLTHFASYRAREKRLLKRLRDLGARIGGILGGQTAAPRRGDKLDIPAEGPAAEAEQVRRRLLAAFASLPDGSPLGADFEPVLNNFVEQIVLLDRKSREIDEIVRGIPLAELERDLVILRKRREEADSEKVRTEYDRSIAEIRTQQASSSELRNEREILRLRLASSLNQLKQLEIDAARMRTVTIDQEPASVEMLRDKSRELSRYLDDLREGYRDLE
jgi:hypothetical protein